MVTGDMNVYFGSLLITHEEILYGILHRPSHIPGEVHQRFIASKVERPMFEMYSGIMVKVGNISIRPLASEFFYMPVAPKDHPELYRAFEDVKAMQWHSPYPIEDTSVIAEYIAITPPPRSRSHPDWERVRYVRNFPILSKLSTKSSEYIELFREPLRTLSAETLNDTLTDGHLDIFRQTLKNRATS